MKKKKIRMFRATKLENMMINISAEGRDNVWMSIEQENDAHKRCHLRKIFTKALKKLKLEGEENGKCD